MSDRSEPLYLHEELLLIILRDDTGTVDWRAGMYQFALSAALLSELLLAGRIAVRDDKKKLVDLVDPKPLGDELLDDCLQRIATASRRARLATWVQRFGQLRELRHRTARALCRRGALREAEDRVLWIFRRRIYPELDARFERDLIERLRRAVFRESRTVDPRTTLLVSLTHRTGLLPIVFDKTELRRCKERLERLCEGEFLGRAAGEAVRAAQAACFVACTAASVATSAACH